MAAPTLSVALAIAVAAAATVAELRPFSALVHNWLFALGVALAGAVLFLRGLGGVRARPSLALAKFGSALLAGAVLHGAFVGGDPQRVPAVPGQVFRPPHSLSVAVAFPEIRNGDLEAGRQQAAVGLVDGALTHELRSGDESRVGPYVFEVAQGPLAHVAVTSASGSPQTITQPNGAAFVSPYLAFVGESNGHPVDLFAVPALHRLVTVVYYSGLPSRGINIPFLLLRIKEENGGVLGEGVAVSAKPIAKSGMVMRFLLGTYPAVSIAGAPARLPFALGMTMVCLGLGGFALKVRGGHRRARR